MHTITSGRAFGVGGKAVWAADAKAGKATFDLACKSCHGADGAPNAAIAKMMKVDIKDLKSPEVQGMTNDAMAKVITEGRGKMNAIKSVSGTAVDNVVAYVKTLKSDLA
jgi:mono/diheme cytochrome c family protein